MATESSAVVRFINLAQQSQNPVRPTTSAPITSEFGTEVVREVRSRPSRAPLIVGAIALAGGAAIGGVYLGKNGFGGPDSPKSEATKAAPAAAPLAAAERADTTPAAPAAIPPAPVAAAPAPAPEVTTPAVAAPTDVLAATGFDIRVQPGATITLDGSVLGKAPLRVRNLQPGPHVVDLEAPPGFFSRRVDLSLGAGEAKDLRFSLDPIEEETTRTADADTASTQTAKSSSKSRSSRSRADLRRERREKVREEQERKKEMRAARAAAAKAAKADKSEKAAVVTEALPDEPKAKEPAKDAKMDAADAELEAAMAEIVGKKAPKSAASAAGASSLTASAPAPSSGKGTLMLGSKPPCDIILDGRPTGLKTPQRAMELAPGTHSVVLVNPELGLEKKFKVKIAPGKTTKAIQDLTDKID